MTPTLATTDPVLLDFAAAVGDQGPVAVAGSRTRWDLGGDPDPEARLISAPGGIVEYQPDEMTVTVRAGTLVETLQATLAEHDQISSLPDRGGSVGGAIVVGENDVRALGRGMMRESVLQVRYVSAEGRIITSGGPTVKNVSGFDLPRLMVGSLGTLGLVAEVILRTNPTPPTTRWMELPGADPMSVVDAVLSPNAVMWDGSTVWVELAGHLDDVDAESSVLAALGPCAESDGPPELPQFRWSLSPSELLDAPAIIPGRFVGCVGLGLVFAEHRQPPRRPDPAANTVAAALKANFDPTGRLNPGRDPGRR